MSGKTDKQFLFEVQLNWLADTRGILSANDAAGNLQVAMSPALGGQGKPWTPKHFFLNAISSCFMTTYLAFAKKIHFEIFHFECDTIRQIEIVDGKYKFTYINLYPKIFIVDKTFREKATLALEKHRNIALLPTLLMLL